MVQLLGMFCQRKEGLGARLCEQEMLVLRAKERLGFALKEKGQLDEAEPLLREVLGAYRVELGTDDDSTLKAITNLALLLQARGKYTEAEEL